MLKGFEKYQLEWMIEHGYSLYDLMKNIQNVYEYLKKENYNSEMIDVIVSYEVWHDFGFDSKIWDTKDEWEDSKILDIYDSTYYNIGFINNDGKEDEAQFKVSKRLSVDEGLEELMNLFDNFCKENQIENKCIISINKDIL